MWGTERTGAEADHVGLPLREAPEGLHGIRLARTGLLREVVREIDAWCGGHGLK